MAKAPLKSRARQQKAIAPGRHPGKPNYGFRSMHAVPCGSVLFLSSRRQECGPPAFDHRNYTMTKARVTLDRVLSRAGIASRTQTRDWIAAGRVKVNGRVVRNPDHWVEGKDVVHLDGMRIRAEKKIYIALNKPTGVVSSRSDKKSRPTVYDFVKSLDRWVFPVGRLDMDTSGLLILTNDTTFGDLLLSPESKIPKTYYVKVSGMINLEDYFSLAYGLDIGRGESSGRAAVREVRRTEKYTWFELTITEGKNRQVRRMCEAIGHPVLKLVRIRIGDYLLQLLPVGKFVELKPSDLRLLLRPGHAAAEAS
jgi:23S rRNA pseudouridine2605 synthase